MSPIILLFFLLLRLSSAVSAAHLSTRKLKVGFYQQTCKKAEDIVRDVLKKAMKNETRVAASIMRLQFHDCFVNGCDASLLLDDTASMLGEKLSLANIGSLRSYEVVDQIKEALEKQCPGVVSCADIIVMASRDAVVLSGGQSWAVKLGRIDSLSASQNASNDIMPSPQTNATELITLFRKFNLGIKDLVALSGSHSIGKGRCFNEAERIYNYSSAGGYDPTINPKYLQELKNLCPLGGDEEVTGDLDKTPTKFDNRYFHDLINGTGFFVSDESLYTDCKTRPYVEMYAQNQTKFFCDFAESMIKMGNLQSGVPGEIRKNCSRVNNPQ